MSQAPVMTAGIFCGTTKPESAEEYLRPMVVEMNDLMQRDIIVHGCHVAIRLRAIVADTPARAFIKGVKGHTGYDSCLKCTVVGKYSQAGCTMTFPGTNALQRTDKCFRDNAYPGHRKTETPLVDLQFFNIIKDIPTPHGEEYSSAEHHHPPARVVLQPSFHTNESSIRNFLG
ncbi:uncharacterized protein LOC118506811 [Anopheles stephensi]|uniref:uncharacterized protein LOC118506811 n=2 Tax=Anopheles stephensi TaxID=30069 RepID=UPI0016587A73|nr:uncharacterized protein LOC118506811 [Anopheles stephensi]